MGAADYVTWMAAQASDLAGRGLRVVDAVPPLAAVAGVGAAVGAYHLYRVGLEKWLYGEPIGARALMGACMLSVSGIVGELATL